MNKTIFEQMGGTYTMHGNYCLPNLILPSVEEPTISVWGDNDIDGIFNGTIKSGTSMCSLPVSFNHTLQMLRKKHKHSFSTGKTIHRRGRCYQAENLMEWARRMNNISNRILESIGFERIFIVEHTRKQACYLFYIDNKPVIMLDSC